MLVVGPVPPMSSESADGVAGRGTTNFGRGASEDVDVLLATVVGEAVVALFGTVAVGAVEVVGAAGVVEVVDVDRGPVMEVVGTDIGRLDVVEDVELVASAAAAGGAVVEEVVDESATAGVAVNQMVADTAPAAMRAGHAAFPPGREDLRLAAMRSGYGLLAPPRQWGRVAFGRRGTPSQVRPASHYQCPFSVIDRSPPWSRLVGCEFAFQPLRTLSSRPRL